MAESGKTSGTRELDVRAAARTGVFVVMLCSVLGLIGTVGSPTHLMANRTGLLITAASGLVVTPLALRLMWNHMSWNLLYFAVILVACGFALGTYFGGSRIQFGVMLYVIVAIYASYYFSLIRAVIMVGLIALAWGLQLGLQEGWEAPVIRWVYVLGVLIVSVGFVNSLVRVAERSAQREKKAREAEEKARLELAELNEALEAKVAEQVTEMEHLGRLRRFLSPNLADVVVGSEHEAFLEPHRREIAVFFIDLRGFTAFASATEPEEVLEVLRAYYEKLGAAFARFEATVGPIEGDGVMAYFNDPFPCEAPAVRAVEMAHAIADSLEELSSVWRGKGFDLGYGIGIAFGYATLGMIGFEGRQDYGPLGTVVNLASRLCDLATSGQILVDRRTATAVSARFGSDLVRSTEIRGFRDPVDVFQVAGDGQAVPNIQSS
jgi:class 3 adenylate cyclase